MILISRRLERYRMIYSRKIMIGNTPNCGLIWENTDRKGNMFKIPYSPNSSPNYVKSIRINSFQVQGPALFNILPRDIRDSEASMEGWKILLDKFLENIPDCPITSDLDSGLCDRNTACPTNSVYEWIPHLSRNGGNLVS